MATKRRNVALHSILCGSGPVMVVKNKFQMSKKMNNIKTEAKH